MLILIDKMDQKWKVIKMKNSKKLYVLGLGMILLHSMQTLPMLRRFNPGSVVVNSGLRVAAALVSAGRFLISDTGSFWKQETVDEERARKARAEELPTLMSPADERYCYEEFLRIQAAEKRAAEKRKKTYEQYAQWKQEIVDQERARQSQKHLIMEEDCVATQQKRWAQEINIIEGNLSRQGNNHW